MADAAQMPGTRQASRTGADDQHPLAGVRAGLNGPALLDREVAEMIQRADPMPAMPDDMDKTELALVVPIQFQLR